MVRKIIIKGNTVYEMKRGKPQKIMHGINNYFKMHQDEKESNMSQDEIDFLVEMEDAEREEEEERRSRILSSSERRKQILKTTMGNKKKLISKADGLDKEIGIIDTEPTPEPKKTHYNKYRKKKPSKSTKRKPKKVVKKCKCK